MRPSVKISYLTAEIDRLTRLVAVLEGQLAAAGIEAEIAPPAWSEDLAPMGIRIMTILLEAYPKLVSRWALEEALPKLDHVVERDAKVIDVHIAGVRRALGKAAVETQYGQGFRCGAEFHRQHGAARQARTSDALRT